MSASPTRYCMRLSVSYAVGVADPHNTASGRSQRFPFITPMRLPVHLIKSVHAEMRAHQSFTVTRRIGWHESGQAFLRGFKIVTRSCPAPL